LVTDVLGSGGANIESVEEPWANDGEDRADKEKWLEVTDPANQSAAQNRKERYALNQYGNGISAEENLACRKDEREVSKTTGNGRYAINGLKVDGQVITDEKVGRI
jgi:hypothetical protein